MKNDWLDKLVKEIHDDVAKTVEFRKVDGSGAQFPIYGSELTARTKAAILKHFKELPSMKMGRIIDTQSPGEARQINIENQLRQQLLKEIEGAE